MAPRRRCPTCGSKQWHKEPSSGLIACSEGHVLLNYRAETMEVEEMGRHAMKKRAMKSGQKKKGKQSTADPKLYHGSKGRFHYFLCLQLILRKQIVALSKIWNLPTEFELICKDLWALHLNLLPDPPPAVSDEADEDLKKAGEEESEVESLIEDDSESSESFSEGEGQEVSRARERKGNRQYEGIMSTVCILIVGCWTLRVPVMYRDFNRLVEGHRLPYLDAVKLLPSSMAEHLTKHNIQALSPRHAPRTEEMHRVASRLARKLYEEYGIYTPEANGASMLWRLVRQMGGSPVIYRMTKRAGSMLSLNLTLDKGLSPKVRRKRAKDGYGARRESVPAEESLMRALITVMKLISGGEMAEEVKGRKLRMEEEEKQQEVNVFDSRKELRVGDLDEDILEEYIGYCSQIL